jgi:surface carbohydrate biosynthesis protein (TIGR04326 family)
LQSIIIWDSSQSLPQTNQSVITWNGYSVDGCISLLTYVDINKKRLRIKYLNWVHSVGLFRINDKSVIEFLAIIDGFSLWWMSLLVEKSLWKSPAIEDAIRMFALEEIILENKPEKIRLVSDNIALHKTIGSFCNNLDIIYTASYPRDFKKFDSRKLYKLLPSIIKAILSLAKYLFNHWNLKKSIRPIWKSENDSIFFCSYLGLIDSKEASKNIFHSSYWKNLHILIKNLGLQSNWLHLFAPCESSKTTLQAVTLVKSFNKNQEQKEAHSFLDTYLDFSLLIRVFRNYFKLVLAHLKVKKIKNAFIPLKSNFSLWPIMKQDWNDSFIGPVAINNLLLYELFDAVMKDLPKQSKGFYLCENQAWERAFIFAWKKYKHGKLIAVPHSTRSFWDLRFSQQIHTVDISNNYPLPVQDFTVVNGKISLERFIDENYLPEKLCSGEALRYDYLFDYNKKNNNRILEDVAKIKVIILGDFNGTGTHSMLQQLEIEIKKLKVPVSFAIKPHPYHMIDVGNYPSLKLHLITNDLASVLKNYHIAYSSNNTSAAVDSYVAGLNIVITLDSRHFNLSPLMGQHGVKFVNSAYEFVSWINENQFENFNNIKQKNDFFFLNPELPNWRKLLIN